MIQFSQTVLIITFQFSICIDFYYTQLNVKTVLFQAIQFSLSVQFNISMQFSSIWPIDRALSGATTQGQSGPGSDGNEGVLCIPQSSCINGTSSSGYLVSLTGHSLKQSYPSAEKQLVYSTSHLRVDWGSNSYEEFPILKCCILCRYVRRCFLRVVYILTEYMNKRVYVPNCDGGILVV